MRGFIILRIDISPVLHFIEVINTYSRLLNYTCVYWFCTFNYSLEERVAIPTYITHFVIAYPYTSVVDDHME